MLNTLRKLLVFSRRNRPYCKLLKAMNTRQTHAKKYAVQSVIMRLQRLSSRSGGHGGSIDAGYSLPLALIASFALLIGVGALASRGSLGFVGQVFQTQNREARDVAESAIAEFSATMNQERNRHLLIAGTVNNWDSQRWTDDGQPTDRDFRNVCTVFDDQLVPSLANDESPVYINPDPIAINRFQVGSTQDLVAGNNTRRFTVESIQFLNENRSQYVDASDNSLSRTFPGATGESAVVIPYWELYRSGRERSLIRITVLGSITRNGRTSSSRVAKEFEVVPKCCKRSFGSNVIGGVNWGRDQIPCGGEGSDDSGLSGVIVGLGGAAIGGSSNTKPGIIQQDGSTLSEASCYGGPVDSSNSTLTSAANSQCTAGSMSQGGISYTPNKLDYTPPIYSHPSELTPSAPTINVSSGSDYIYFNPLLYDRECFTNAGPNCHSGVIWQKPASAGGGPPGSSPPVERRINNAILGDASLDPCYTKEVRSLDDERPYYVVNCLVSGFNTTGNDRLYVDTSVAQINFFFVGNGNYGSWSGNSGVYRIHGNSNGVFQDPVNAQSPSNCIGASPTGCLLDWNNGDPTTAAGRLNSFLELCADRAISCDNENYAVRRLMNFYASGTGTFDFNGLGAGVGFNIYAPNATVNMNGQGDFMGQLWTNRWNPNGNIQMRTFSGGGDNASGGSPPPFAFGKPLVDFVVRSFTQSSGFGL